jgi:hypothetical protein
MPDTHGTSLPWVKLVPGVPYFETEDGPTWTPIGQNNSLEWVSLDGIYNRHDMEAADSCLRNLADTGVTCTRLMM